jgi:hypothetical protein
LKRLLDESIRFPAEGKNIKKEQGRTYFPISDEKRKPACSKIKISKMAGSFT